MRAVVAQTGALAGKARRALDSTVLDDAVATEETVTELAVRLLRRADRDRLRAGSRSSGVALIRLGVQPVRDEVSRPPLISQSSSSRRTRR